MEELIQRMNSNAPKIQGLTYAPLRILFDPLHVKMAEALRDETKAQTAQLMNHRRDEADRRAMASETGIPPEDLDWMDLGSDDKPDDDDDTNFPDNDDFGGGDDDDDDYKRGNMTDYTEGGGSMGSGPGPSSRNLPSKRYPKPGFGQGTLGGGGPPPPGAPTAGVAYRESIEVQQELQALRSEMARMAQQQAIAEEIRRGNQVKNPVKELIREIHYQPQVRTEPIYYPVENQQSKFLLEAAKARNFDLTMLTERLGLTVSQLASQLGPKPPPAAEPVMASSSSGGPPPPPPPSARMPKSRSPVPKPQAPIPTEPVTQDGPGRSRSGPRAKIPVPPVAIEPAPMGAQPDRRALSQGSEPGAKRANKAVTFDIATPRPSQAPVRPSQAPVRPSRAPVRPSQAPSPAPSSRPSSAPSPAPSAAPSMAPTKYMGPGSALSSRQSSRQPSAVSVASSRKPSTQPRGISETSLPDYPESRKSSVARTRSPILLPTTDARLPPPSEQAARAKKIITQMLESQADPLQKSVRKLQLSRFARETFAASKRAKRAKSFDELEAEAEMAEADIPRGSAVQKQKTGFDMVDFRRRFQGRAIRAASR